MRDVHRLIRLFGVLATTSLLATSGCAWCIDQCFGPPARPVRPPPPRPRTTDPCELVPGATFRADNGDALYFDVDYVEFRPRGIQDGEIYDWRCRDSWIQFREGGLASDALLHSENEIEWLGVRYHRERRN